MPVRLATALAAAAAVGTVLLAVPPAVAASAAAGTTASTTAMATITRRSLPVLPGFRTGPAGPVLDVQRFTTVGVLSPTRPTGSGAAVLAVALRVDVPTRVALSVRAWCDPGAEPGAEPGERTLPDVLVIGQNPVPGRSTLQRASRTLTGRAVVDLGMTDGTAPVRCLVQVSPRTESVVGSTMTVLAGSVTLAPAPVLARGAQRPAVLVGPPDVRTVREVAGTGTVATSGGVRVEGEAELTTCALGYHLCGRGTAPTSVADVALRLDDVTSDGRVCRAWRGGTRRITITPAVHHVKVAAPPLRVTRRCGDHVRAALRVTHVGGNAVEVEPTLGLPGDPARVQTHTWIESA